MYENFDIGHDLKMAFEDGYLAGVEATQPKWISVEDRLPKQYVSVLVYMPDEYPRPTVHEGYLMPDGIWDAAHYLRNPDEVTHWMPLPEPPCTQPLGTDGCL